MEQRSITASSVLVSSGVQLARAASMVRRRSAWRQWVVVTGLVLSEVFLVLVCWEMASVIQGFWGEGPLSWATIAALIPTAAVWVGSRALLGMYPGYGLNSIEHLRRHTHTTFVTLALLAILALALQIAEDLSRLQFGLVFLSLLVLAPATRYLVKSGMKKTGMWGKPVVILGYKDNGGKVFDLLTQEWALGYDPIAVFNYRLEAVEGMRDGTEDQQAMSGVMDLGREHGVDTVIFAMPHTRREQLAKLVGLASLGFRHVMIIPNLSGVTNSSAIARDLAGICALELRCNLLSPWALRAKRVADVVATVVGGILITPLILVLALLVYLESGRPIFYVDQRVGKDSRLFSCVKFRTMVSDAEVLLQRMLQEDASLHEEYSKYHKLRNDPRITRIGRFLRKTSLDELPQIWNVLRGEMSLVGPRPYLPRESEDIGISQREILRVPPGITGPWQVSGRNHVMFSERVEMDTYYVHDWSVWLDIVLLIRTAKILLFERSAY